MTQVCKSSQSHDSTVYTTLIWKAEQEDHAKQDKQTCVENLFF